MMDGVVTQPQPATDGGTIGVEALYDGFQTYCKVCHAQPKALMGNLLVTSLDNFKLNMTGESVARLNATDLTTLMPQGQSKLLSERAASDPLVVFAKRLEAWLKAGKPDRFADPTANVPADGMPPASAAAPFAVGPAMGSALTNLGSCIPAREIVNVQSDKMDQRDAQFAAMTSFADLPRKLSETDLFSLDSEQLAAEGVISFAPGYTLWADDAHKMRYVRVPRGQSIAYRVATQSFDIPDNTRFYKTFLKDVKDAAGNVGYRKMETRLIVARRSEDKPGDPLPTIHALFGTYQWNEDETEATLVTEPYRDGTPFADVMTEYVRDEQLKAQLDAEGNRFRDYYAAGAKRHYGLPGADRCVQCHMGEPSFVLGFLPLQIWRRPMGSDGVIEPTEPDELNQLERLIDYGLITGLAKDQIAKKIVPLEKSQGTRLPRNNAELVAQGYMLGNCAYCHNPNGYPSRTAPVLRDVLNMMPSADGGGIFEFPLTRVSPRIRRTLSNPAQDDGAREVHDVPYIASSLYDSGWNGTSPYSWRRLLANGRLPPTMAPWRSLIYRNTQAAFTYSDGTTIYPHMPLHTPGFDCRAPNIMAEWMLSIPTVDLDSNGVAEKDDVRAVTRVEIDPADPQYATASLQVAARLQTYRDDPVVKTCNNNADVVDANTSTPDNWPYSVLDVNNPDFPFSIPNRNAWIKLDTHADLSKWTPRGAWRQALVGKDVSNYPATQRDSQVALIEHLRARHRDDAFRAFALKERPLGFWKTKPECSFAGVPTSRSIAPSPDWVWLADHQKEPERPVYMQAPGEAIFDMVCVNCHGATFDANGRQAVVVSDLTGGTATVANFRDGMFGPRGMPGGARQSVFGDLVGAEDSIDDWSARYMAWMALGGTRAAIPPAVLQVVGDNPVLGESVSRGVTASANMLEVAKVVCSSLLPTFEGKTGAFGKCSAANGDCDLWRAVCSYDNPFPVRVFPITVAAIDAGIFDVASTIKTRSSSSYPVVRLYKRAAALANASFLDLTDQTRKTGVGLDVNQPACAVIDAGSAPTRAAELEQAYRAANLALPLCDAALSEPGAVPTMTEEEQNSWTLHGAVSAGFSVFTYIDAATKGQVKPKADYDRCENLSASQPEM